MASYVGQVDLSIRCSAHYCSAWTHILQLLIGSSINLSHLDGPRIVSIPSHKRKPTGGPEVNIRRRMPRPRFEPRRGQNFYNPPNRSLRDTSTEQKSFTHNTRIRKDKKIVLLTLFACVILSAGAMLIFSVLFQIDQVSPLAGDVSSTTFLIYIPFIALRALPAEQRLADLAGVPSLMPFFLLAIHMLFHLALMLGSDHLCS